MSDIHKRPLIGRDLPEPGYSLQTRVERLTRQLAASQARVAELEEECQGLAEEANEALNHNDETCSAVAERDRAQAIIEQARTALEALNPEREDLRRVLRILWRGDE